MCRVAGKALYETTLNYNSSLKIYCMHDRQVDADENKYFPSEIFRGFGGGRKQFILSAVREGMKADVVIISHINLLVVGWLIKKTAPSTKLILFAHGIEIWDPLGSIRKKMLLSCDVIVSVSHYTSQKIQEVHGIAAGKCKVLNNCLDPFLPLPTGNPKNERLLYKYGFTKNNQILFTLSRLSSRERYKGYDKVLEAMISVKDRYPGIRYLLSGSYDSEEKSWLDEMIKKMGLQENVVMTGYLQEEELAPHFELAEVYVMPSRKEGFGIVFIEAMYYGLPVIAGNADGSVDALCNGELGLLVSPDSVEEIKDAIENILAVSKAYKPNRELLLKQFSYESYKEKLNNALMR